MPHGHCSPQGPGQGAAAFPSVFPWDKYRQVSSSPWETTLPLRPREEFPTGEYGLALLSLAVIPLLDSAFSPPAVLQRLMLELNLILLAKFVILRSSHSTFQSILGTTAAQLRQRPYGGHWPLGLCLTEPFDTAVIFCSSSLCSNSTQKPLCSFWLFFYLFFSICPSLVLASVGKKYSMSERRKNV